MVGVLLNEFQGIEISFRSDHLDIFCLFVEARIPCFVRPLQRRHHCLPLVMALEMIRQLVGVERLDIALVGRLVDGLLVLFLVRESPMVSIIQVKLFAF